MSISSVLVAASCIALYTAHQTLTRLHPVSVNLPTLRLKETFVEREAMEVDVVIVGAGPAGLSTACRLAQASQENGQELSIVVVEKGSEVGAHLLSGAVFEAKALTELFPNWKEDGAPLNTPVTRDDIFYLTGAEKGIKVPNLFVPKTMHNEGKDRKSTRLNSSHVAISYAVFCLK